MPLPPDYQSESDTEPSYDNLSTRVNVAKTCLNYYHSILWQFIVTMTNVFLLFIDSYHIFFNRNYRSIILVRLVLCAFDVIVVLDTIFITSPLWLKKSYKRSLYESYNLTFSILECLTLYTVVADIFELERFELRCAKYACLFFRNHRIFMYYVYIFKQGNNHPLAFMSKYIPIFTLYIHICACLWHNGCKNCSLANHPDNSYYHHSDMENVAKDFKWQWNAGRRNQLKEEPNETYVFALFFVIGSITRLGYGDPSPRNSYEQFWCCFIMVSSNILILFMTGDLAATKMQIYCNQLDFSDRLHLIFKFLSNPRFNQRIRNKTITYYISYWEKQNGLDTGQLLNYLPSALRSDIMLDEYWFAINQASKCMSRTMSIFQNEEVYVKRLVASLMVTEYFNKDAIILKQGGNSHDVFFIARGSVFILSEEDGESPLLSLGVGTTFGDLCLFYSHRCRFSVVAQTYCILHVLKKKNLWRLQNFVCLDVSKRLGKLLKNRIRDVKLNRIYNKNSQVGDTKALVKMKKILITDVELRIYDARRIFKPFENYYDSYVLSNVQSKRIYDGLFYQTTWPWKLYDNSSLIFLWECFVIVIVTLMLIIWPIKIYLENDYNDTTLIIYKWHFWIFFTLDVIIQVFTVVETPSGIHYKLDDIFTQRWTDFVFICDVIAALPLDIAIFSSYETDLRWYYIASMSLKLCKVKRIPMFIKKMENRYLFVQMRNFRLFNYIFLLLALSYVCGCFYYLLICFDNVGCYVGHWSDIAKKSSWEKLLYVFHFSLSMITQTAITTIMTQRELIWSMVYSIFALYILYYFIADFAAYYVLADNRWNKFLSTVDHLQLFLQSHLIDKHMKERIERFVWAQWQYDKCATNRNLFYDTPDDFYQEQQIEFYLEIIKEQRIFQCIDNQVCRVIAEKCETVFIPEGEIVIYGGVIMDNVYIVDQGYCEIISAITGKTKKIMGPKDDLNCIEALLRKPTSNDIRAVTSLSLVRINLINIKYAFALSPSIYKMLNELVTYTLSHLKDDMRLFTCRQIHNNYNYTRQERMSWFVFPKKSKDPLYIDLKKNYSSDNLLWLLQYILMHRTLYPSGKFIIAWEINRMAIVWIMCMLSPLEVFYFHSIPYLWYISVFFYVYLLIDMYLQMHVAYYNQKGLLVSHPNFTAQHYLRTRMIIDLLGFLPITILIHFIFSIHSNLSHKHQLIFGLNRYLLLIRSRCILQKTNFSLESGILGKMVYFFFILTACYNCLATILVVMTCYFDHTKNKDNMILIAYAKTSLVGSVTSKGDKNLFDYYVISILFVGTKFLNIGYERSDVITNKLEMHYYIVIYFTGYILLGCIAIHIASKFAISMHLSKHHSYLSNLKKFMKKENISKNTIKYTLDHFHYVWLRNKGAPNAIVEVTSLPIRYDFALNVYGTTIEMAVPFHNTDISFKRRLGYHLIEELFDDRAIIIDNNDIVDHMYLVHKGVVNVVGPAGDVIDSIGIGSIFGNYDNVNKIRSMVGIVAWGKVDILKIPTTTLYSVLADEKIILQKIQEYQKLNFISYIKRKPIPRKEVDFIKSPLLLKLRHLMLTKYYFMWDMVAVLVSYVAVSYYIVFNGFYTKYIIIAIDIWVVIKIFLDLMNPRYNRYNCIKMMVKKNALSFRFLIDLVSVLPLEFIAYNSNYSEILYRGLHANRFLRLCFLYNYFVLIDLSRHKNIMVIKVCSILCCNTVLLHTAACIFYFIARPNGPNKNLSWLYNNNEEQCSEPYICAMNFAISSLLGRGHCNLKPKTFIEGVLIVMYATIYKFYVAILLGYALAIAVYYKTELSQHINIANNLQNSLRHSNISPILLSRVWNYTLHMWIKNRGKQIPNLIHSAPKHIMSMIKMEAFGKHILNSAIFEDCHSDFIRQLVLVLDVQNYFCDDIICHKGDINDIIYFIHRGNVEVIKDEKSGDLIVDDLEEGDCFGLVQGLFPCKKHEFAYRARNVVEIVTLEHKKWSYLLPFFPASAFIIYNKLESLLETHKPSKFATIIRPNTPPRRRMSSRPTVIELF